MRVRVRVHTDLTGYQVRLDGAPLRFVNHRAEHDLAPGRQHTLEWFGVGSSGRQLRIRVQNDDDAVLCDVSSRVAAGQTQVAGLEPFGDFPTGIDPIDPWPED